MVFSSLLATSASSATIDETGAIIDNNTFATAHTMGYWQYHGSTVCKLESGETEAYFSFTANANDRVYASCWDAKNLASARIHTWPPDA